jgi:BASS family bile acid:Na+ symporter
MTVEQFVVLVLKFSMALIVLRVGLISKAGDLVSLLRRPGLLARSLLAMNVVLPLIAFLVAEVFSLNRQVEIALVALMLSPVPPILPNKEIKSGADAAYAVSLLVVSALVAVVTVPLSLKLLGLVLGQHLGIPHWPIFKMVLITVLAPLSAGAAIRHYLPALAARVSRPLGIAGNVLLVAAFVPVLIAAWPQLVAQVGNFTIVAVIAIVVAGLAVGHWLGGPNPSDRTALALSTASRHPGVAIAVAGAVAPGDRSVVMAVLLAFLISVIATGPYARWRRRAHEAERAADRRA